jgi:Fe-S-cluster-containing dehydrogenase component
MRKKRYGMLMDLRRCIGCHPIDRELDMVGAR